MKFNNDLIEDLRKSMSLTRLANVGLFQRLDFDIEHEAYREVRLHRAVLDKALVDMFSVVPVIKKDVDTWLSLKNRDFIDAAERAALDPELVYKVFMLMKEILVGDKARFKKFGPRKQTDEKSKEEIN